MVLSQSQDHSGGVTLNAVNHLASASDWFIGTLTDLAAAGVVVYPLVCAIVKVCRQALWSHETADTPHDVLNNFVSKLLEVIRFDNTEAEKLFK